LRHTHATIMLQLGKHPKVSSERLSHSPIAMTINTYAHVTLDMPQESSNRFEKTLKNSRSQINVVKQQKIKRNPLMEQGGCASVFTLPV
jgi:hypothetical protein